MIFTLNSHIFQIQMYFLAYVVRYLEQRSSLELYYVEKIKVTFCYYIGIRLELVGYK